MQLSLQIDRAQLSLLPPLSTPHNDMSDPRFARLHTDPRFVRPKASKSKIVVDDRFKQLFQDQEGESLPTPLQPVHQANLECEYM